MRLVVSLASCVIVGVVAPTLIWASDDDGRSREPYLSVRTGLKCSACHTNRTGGGMRTAFGSVYAQTNLPAKTEGFTVRTGSLNDWATIGTDFRVLGYVALADATPQSAIEIEEANVYFEARFLRRAVVLYIDETVGPGGASARELFAMWEQLPLNSYAKVGKFLLPYGFRLVDDQEFIRDVTGFSYLTPDQGIEVGFEPGPFSAFVALTNGTQGSVENDDQKQITGSAAYIHRWFRLGGSASRNEGESSRRDVVGGFGGVTFGPITLLGEADWIFDRTSSSNTDRFVAYGESDILVSQGFNVKATFGYHDPDINTPEDHRSRARFGLETFPVPFVQLSGFYVLRKDVPQEPNQQDLVTVEVHLYF